MAAALVCIEFIRRLPASRTGGGRPTAAACASLVWVAIVRRRWPSARSVVTGSRRQPYISVSFLFAHIVVCSTTLCAGPRDTRCATSGRFGSPAPARPTRLSGRHTTPRAPSLARHPVTAPLVPLGKRRAASRRSPVSSRRLSAVHNSGIARGHGHAVGATIAIVAKRSRRRWRAHDRIRPARPPVFAEIEQAPEPPVAGVRSGPAEPGASLRLSGSGRHPTPLPT